MAGMAIEDDLLLMTRGDVGGASDVLQAWCPDIAEAEITEIMDAAARRYPQPPPRDPTVEAVRAKFPIEERFR